MKQQTIKTIQILIVISLCLSVASAFDYNLTAGDTFTQDLGFEIVNCSITNNASNLQGLNLSWNDSNITISTVSNYKPDKFTIDCWVIKYKKVVEEEVVSSSGGGGGCQYNKNFDWNCSEWGECIEGNQTRTCKKYNNCHNAYGKPVEVQTCTVKIEIDEQGCILTEGYAWCESKQKCLNPEVEKCIDQEVEEEKSNNLYFYFLISFFALVVLISLIWILSKKFQKQNSEIKK